MTQLLLRDNIEQSAYNRTLSFARQAHGAQVRKYTQEPYWHHPEEVAIIVSTVPGRTLPMLQAALLHDVLEDTNRTEEDLRDYFGDYVTELVVALTDPPRTKGGPSRAERQVEICLAIGECKWPWAVQTIKTADLMSNTKSIVEHDPNFAKVYLEEKHTLLHHMLDGDALLWREAVHQVYMAQRKLAGLQ